jgi:hypothetical protein
VSLLVLHPLALVVSEAFSEYNLLPRTSSHQRSPRGVSKVYDGVVRVLRITAMLFKESKLKFLLIKNARLKGEKRESPV